MAPADACQPYREFYSDLVEGEIEGLEAERIRSHLAECIVCDGEVKLLTGVVGTLRAIGEEEVPAALTARIMHRVRTPTLGERLAGLIAALLRPTAVRVLVPVAAVALLFIAARPHLPIQIHIDTGTAPGGAGHELAVVPVWWGGKLIVNESAHGPEKSGRLVLRPGDSVRTTDGVELSLTFPEAGIDVRARTRLIVKHEGLFLAGGRIRARIDDARERRPGMGSFTVETAHARIVHLGTIFSVEADEQGTRVEVTQGRVRVFAAGGDTQEIPAGQSGSIDAQGAVSTGPASDELPPVRSPRKQPEDVNFMRRDASGAAAGPGRP
jgi:hypothetical protein